MNKKTSPIWNIEINKLQNLLDNSSSFVDVLISLGLNGYTGNHRTLKMRIKHDKLSINKLNENRMRKIILNNKKKISLDEVLVANSSYSRGNLKRRIIEASLLPYICEKCKNWGTWFGDELVLQLEHKNGISNDNRLENLCFLCPNCHSQTKTFSGKNSILKGQSYNYCGCGAKKQKNSITCVECYNKKKILKRKFEVSKEELEKLIKEKTMTEIGKLFGVTDNIIRKRAKLLNIDWRRISPFSRKPALVV